MRKKASTRLVQGTGMRLRSLFGFMAVCLMVISLVAVPAALAEEDGTDEPPPASAQTENGENAALQNAFMNKLAANLGVTTDKLQSAIAQTEQEMVQEGVENGILPEEKAEEMQAYIEENGSLRGYGLSVAQQRMQERLHQAVEKGIIGADKAGEIEQRFQQVRERVMERIQNRVVLREAWEDCRRGPASQVWNRVQSRWNNMIQERLEQNTNSGTRNMQMGPPENGQGAPGETGPATGTPPSVPAVPGTASSAQ
ncbi:MAG: hypothetical protein R6U89_01285 [Dehalococcoidia bacterium]